MEDGLSYAQPRHNITERVQEWGPNTLQSKLQFVNVKEREKDRSIPDNLGPLPQDVGTVGSLTIYNTAESPYSAGLKSDPLEAKMRARKQLDDDVEGGEDVDDSAVGGGGVVSGRDDDMFYNPELGDLPEFDLPDDLMLPNIAQDLTYSQVKKTKQKRQVATFQSPGLVRDCSQLPCHGRSSGNPHRPSRSWSS